MRCRRRRCAGSATTRRARRASATARATAWTRDFDELLQDEDLDAIAFASAELAGRGRALTALECEKHVFVDGLLDSTSAEADKLVAAAARGNRRLLAQAPALLRPEVLRLHRLIDRGALGEIFYVHARRYALRPDLELDLLRDLGLELVALTLDLLGDEPVEAEAYGESYLGRQRPGRDLLQAPLRDRDRRSTCTSRASRASRPSGSPSSARRRRPCWTRPIRSGRSRSTSTARRRRCSTSSRSSRATRSRSARLPDDGLRLGCSRFLTAVRSNGDTSFGREASAAHAVIEALELSCGNRGAGGTGCLRAPPRASRT